MWLLLTGGKSVKGSGLGEDHDGPSQEPEWRPEEETLCRHCYSGRSKGAGSFDFISLTHQCFSNQSRSQRTYVGSGLISFRSCSWMSPRQAWTPAPDIRCGLCWRAAEQAESLSSARTTWTRPTYLLVPTFDTEAEFWTRLHTWRNQKNNLMLFLLLPTDRKAVISQGQLKCVGSSMYLKIKCGVGYHLRRVPPPSDGFWKLCKSTFFFFNIWDACSTECPSVTGVRLKRSPHWWRIMWPRQSWLSSMRPSWRSRFRLRAWTRSQVEIKLS